MTELSAAGETPRIDIQLSGDEDGLGPIAFATFSSGEHPSYEIATEEVAVGDGPLGTRVIVGGPFRIVSETEIDWAGANFHASLDVAGVPEWPKVEAIALGLIALIRKHSISEGN